MDAVFLQGLEVQARLGVPDEERSRPQRVLIDLELGLDLKNAGRGDDVAQTIDYAQVAQEVKHLVQGRSFKLVEAVAESVAAFIVDRFPVAEVCVKVRKFSVPGTESVGVSLVRLDKWRRSEGFPRTGLRSRGNAGP